MNKKGFSLALGREYLERTRNLTPEMKLEWLEEANEFVNKFVPKEKRERWESAPRCAQKTSR